MKRFSVFCETRNFISHLQQFIKDPTCHGYYLSRIVHVTDPILRRKTPFASRLVCDIVTMREQLLICSARHGGWIAVPEEKDSWQPLLNAVVIFSVP